MQKRNVALLDIYKYINENNGTIFPAEGKESV